MLRGNRNEKPQKQTYRVEGGVFSESRAPEPIQKEIEVT